MLTNDDGSALLVVSKLKVVVVKLAPFWASTKIARSFSVDLPSASVISASRHPASSSAFLVLGTNGVLHSISSEGEVIVSAPSNVSDPAALCCCDETQHSSAAAFVIAQDGEAWALPRMSEDSFSRARRVCGPAESPSMRLDGGARSVVSGAVVLPVKDAPLFCLVRAWSSGHAESVLVTRILDDSDDDYDDAGGDVLGERDERDASRVLYTLQLTEHPVEELQLQRVSLYSDMIMASVAGGSVHMLLLPWIDNLFSVDASEPAAFAFKVRSLDGLDRIQRRPAELADPLLGLYALAGRDDESIAMVDLNHHAALLRAGADANAKAQLHRALSFDETSVNSGEVAALGKLAENLRARAAPSLRL